MTASPGRQRSLWLEVLGGDLAYALRTLRRRPGFTLTALLSLALGIGASTGIFSLVDQTLLRLLPVREPERLVLLRWNSSALVGYYNSGDISYPLCRDLDEHEQLFDGVLCRAPANGFLTIGQQQQEVGIELVSGSYFPVLGVRPALGRLFDRSDDIRQGEHPVAVLSYDYWQLHLGGAADVVGRRILVNNHPMTVVGVAAEGFRGVDVGDAVEVWIPAAMTTQVTFDDGLLERRLAFMNGLARLRPGRTAAQTSAALSPWFAARLEAETRDEDFPERATAEERRQFLASTLDLAPGAQGWSFVRGQLRRPLLVLMAGTVLLLLLACLNVAGLFLARGVERTEELSTRMALGATRRRIAGQLLVEGTVVAFAGGLLGLAAAPPVSRVLLFFLPDGAEMTTQLQGRVLLFALAASAVAGLVCSLPPAVQAGRRRLAAAFGQRATSSRGAVWLRKAIVVAQLAATLVLLVGAGLFTQTLIQLQTTDRGFDSARLVMFRADPTAAGYAEDTAAQRMRDLLQALRESPAVERAGVANTGLLGGPGASRNLTIGAVRRVTAGGVPILRVSPGFFGALGARVIAGRDFDAADSRDLEDGEYRTVVVNESFARRYVGSVNAVGERLGIGNRFDTPTDIEIVGVVTDVSRRYVRGDQDPAHLFLPFADSGPLAGDGTFYLRVRGEPESAFGAIRAAVASVDSSLPVIRLGTADSVVRGTLRSERMLAVLSSGFGAAALALSVVGLYGVMSFVVTRRTREIGLRLALGATRAAAVWLIVRDAALMVGAGIVVAAPAAWALRRLVEGQLFGVQAFDGPTLAAAAGGLAVVSLGAATLPAWRAAVLPPMVAIRDQPESAWHTARQTVRRVVHGLTAGSERPAPPVTLISEFTGLVQNAATFPDALRVALPALRERAGARFIMLLEKVSAHEYRGEDLSLPARGVLVNRLTHFPHPLPLTADDLNAWLTWARELRPEHVTEIEQLRDAGVRMAVALRTRREIIGVLLLGPPEARDEFADADKQLLESSAELFALMIENARLNDRALEQEKVRRDLALAAEVQRRLLPAAPPSFAAARLAAFTLPARSVGGDFYDFVELPGGRLGIAVADIAGKGVAAALLTSVVQASLRVITAEGEVDAAQLAARMNRFLHRSTGANGYATFFYAQLEADGRRLRYVNAGHNPPYLVRRTAAGVETTELSAGGTVLGLFPDAGYEDAAVAVCPGDLLVVFTDGVTEARSVSDEEFGEDRLKELLGRAVGATADEVSSLLAMEMREWIAGAEQHDDLTFVVVTIA